MPRLLYFVFLFSILYSCQSDNSSSTSIETTVEKLAPNYTTKVSKKLYGETPDGPADLYTLSNGLGMDVQITNYGGIITAIRVPDKAGVSADVVLGFDSLSSYIKEHPYFGAIIGRYGNRIAKGQFSIEGTSYSLQQNDGSNHLHGGIRGFDKVLWMGTIIDNGISLSYTSPDMEEGYPGNLQVTVDYTLNEKNELKINYSATTDKSTLCNLTNHSYFNLAGTGDILKHQLRIKADWFTPIDKDLIPTGKLEGVKNTPLNFRIPKEIGEQIDADHEQIVLGEGYDHNFVLNMKPRNLTIAASVFEPTSGRLMEVLTTEPGIQFYSGNILEKKKIIGKLGIPYANRSGFCLETQHFPDSPNQSLFPSTILNPGKTYESTTVYRFSVR